MPLALITGGARGIGRAISLELHKQGWDIFINYHTSSEAAKELKNLLGCRIYEADVSDNDAVIRMFKEAGPVDLLVNNAGIAWVGLTTEMPMEEWNRIFAVNVNGVFNCTNAALPSMISRKSGNIINIGSVFGVSGGSCEAAYAATKGAISSFTKSLAKEVGPSGIRVNCISPGAVDTDMLAVLTAEEKSYVCDITSLGRLGTVEDIAEVVAFVASPSASFLTGQEIKVDGTLMI